MTLAKKVISTFYIYADAADLEGFAPEMRRRIEAFVEPYDGRVRVVNQREAPRGATGELPGWDFGINFEFDAVTDSERRDLALFFQSLSAEFERDFVVGSLLPHGQCEDFATIASHEALDAVLHILTTHAPNG